MTNASSLTVVGFMLAWAVGCAHHPAVRVPPRVDLTQHQTIGVINFRSSPDDELGALATRRFTESARRDQGLVRMIDFGSSVAALSSVEGNDLDAGTFRALGREHGVQTILVGDLTLSKTRPSVRIDSGLRSGSVAAQVEAVLAVRLVEAATGASIWSASARASETLGQISVLGGENVAIGADDPARSYAALVDRLVEQTTRDFHAHWTR